MAFVHSTAEDLFKVTFGRDLHAIRGILADRMLMTFLTNSIDTIDNHREWFNKVVRKQVQTVAKTETVYFSNQSLVSNINQDVKMIISVHFVMGTNEIDWKSIEAFDQSKIKLIRLIFYDQSSRLVELISQAMDNEQSVGLLVRVS